MTKKKIIVTIILVGILSFILIFHLDLFRNSQNDFVQLLNRIIVGDKMIVKTSNNLDKGKVRINISHSDKIIYENNRFHDNIENQYGGPMFDLYYDNALVGRAFHCNTNDWYRNKFIFNLYKEKNQIKFKFKTIGRDKNGEQGYILIKNEFDSLFFESYDYNGILINSWKEKDR